MKRLSFAVLVALATWIVPVIGAAQEPSATGDDPAITEAREHFRVAMEHYDAGRFREAAAEFQRSYDLSHRPELLHNIYLSRRDMGDIRGAVDALRLYLTEATIPEGDRTTLVHRLHGMESSLGQAPSPEPVPRVAPTETPAPDADATTTDTSDTSDAADADADADTTVAEDRSLLASPTPAGSSDVTSEGWFWALIVTAGVLVVGGVVAGAVIATTPGEGVQGDVGGRIMTLTF